MSGKLIASLFLAVFAFSISACSNELVIKENSRKPVYTKTPQTDILSNPLPKGVTIQQLDNGMQVLLIENPVLPMVGVNVVVKVGSAYETFASSGMSHMLEHLLFNGTTSRSQKQLYDDVDRIGGYNNANTSEYFTNYMMVTPAENIRKGMEIQADMLFHSVLPEQKFQKEKGIVLEEISKSLANADEQAERNVISLLFKGHALSLPTLGTYSTIEAMKRDQVYHFYKNNYVPNNMLMSVVGKFDSAEMLKMVNEIYGQEAPGKVEREDIPGWTTGFETKTLKPANQGQIYHRFYDGKQEQLQLYFKICHQKSTSFYEFLDIKLRDKEKIFEKILKENFKESFQSLKMTTRTTPVAAYVQVRINISGQADAGKIASFVTDKLKKCDWQLSGDELQTETAKARTAFLKNIEKPHMFGIFNAHEFAVNGIEGVLASYGSAAYSKARKDLTEFKIDSVPIIIFQHPAEREEKTSTAESGGAKLFSAAGKSADLIVKQNAASNLLAIHYLIKHKAPLESKFGKAAAKILHDCFGQRMKSETNKKISAGWGISLKVNDNPFFPMDDRYMNPDYGYIRLEALAEDIPGVIHFLNSQMQNFEPTQAEYRQATAKMKRPNPMMMGGRDMAKKIFNETYKNLLYEKNPYPQKKEIPSYEELLAFAKNYFRPGNMIISVVSPAAPERVREMFAAFSDSAASADFPVYRQELILRQKAQTIDKQGGGKRSYLFWGFIKKINPADKAALKALSLILSDKIIFDIREKQGMAYHMSAGIELTDNKALFYINQGTRPKNVDKLAPQYPGFFSAAMLKDVTEADLEKSLSMYLGRMMFRRLSSINQGYYLGYSYYFHNDINYDQKFLDELKKVKLADVKRVAGKYMQVENPVSVIVR